MFRQALRGFIDAHHQMLRVPQREGRGAVPGPAKRIEHQRARLFAHRARQHLVRLCIVCGDPGAMWCLQVAVYDLCQPGVQVPLIAADGA